MLKVEIIKYDQRRQNNNAVTTTSVLLLHKTFIDDGLIQRLFRQIQVREILVGFAVRINIGVKRNITCARITCLKYRSLPDKNVKSPETASQQFK